MKAHRGGLMAGLMLSFMHSMPSLFAYMGPPPPASRVYRSRTPGKPQPSGAKLASKAAAGRVGISVIR